MQMCVAVRHAVHAPCGRADIIAPMQSDPGPRPQLVIFDLDGVVYRGDRAVPGAPLLIDGLRRARIAVRFATNNSMRRPEDFARRLEAIGVATRAEEIVTSTTATIDHLQRHLPEVRSVLAVGEDGLHGMLQAAGYRVTRAAEAARQGEDGPLNEHYDAVVAGLDLSFGFHALAAAQAALLGGASFVATNADARYPTRRGFLPGAGAMVAAIATASGVAPVVIGKPSPAMFEAILEQTGTPPSAAVVVGDNPDADVVAANRAGIRCALVLTGVADAEAADALSGDHRPWMVARDPAELADRLGAWLS